MEKINLSFQFKYDDHIDIDSIIIADQKDYFDRNQEIVVKGVIYFDINIKKDGKIETIHREKELDLSLAKNKYHLKDVAMTLDDYNYEIKENIIIINLFYIVTGEDICLEKFCSLEERGIDSELRDYLNRDIPLSQINIDENKIIILDPIIEEKPLEVELRSNEKENEKKESLNNTKDENKKIFNKENEKLYLKKDDIFSETYQKSYIFYRVKDGESIEYIAEKFNLKKEDILKLNKNKEIKKDSLIRIQKNV